MRREVEKIAQKAEKFMEVKLFIARLKALKSLTTRPSIEQLLVELDGCHKRMRHSATSRKSRSYQKTQAAQT